MDKLDGLSGKICAILRRNAKPVSVDTRVVSMDTEFVSADTPIRIDGYAAWRCMANSTREKRIHGYA